MTRVYLTSCRVHLFGVPSFSQDQGAGKRHAALHGAVAWQKGARLLAL